MEKKKKTIQIAIELLFDLNEMITLILCMRFIMATVFRLTRRK